MRPKATTIRPTSKKLVPKHRGPQASSKIIARKFQRIRRGGCLRTLDLFSGCGGLSLGFHAAGCEVAGAVELDRAAAKTFAANLGRSNLEGFVKPRDIRKLEPEQVLRECGHQFSRVDSAIDLIVGGPPCQAFARIGRAKLREIRKHPEAFKKDPRAALYVRYLHYVRKLRPLAILMENVPDILNFGGRNLAEEITIALEAMGYRCRYTLLNAANYGVPQARERMFLVGIHRGCKGTFRFPSPIRFADLPSGYRNIRAVALKSLRGVDSDRCDIASHSFSAPPEAPPTLPPAVSVRNAICDLPVIGAHQLSKKLDGKELRGALNHTYPNTAWPKTHFAKLMSAWPGFESPGLLQDHIVRCLPRDFKWFARMKPGMRYPAIHEMAMKAFQREILPKLRKAKIRIPRTGSPAFKAFRAKFVPPYDPSKYFDKWRMLVPDAPSHTLLAHLSKDSYSHIHYDPKQGRTISIREAARLQSFPDGFRFPCGMNDAFRQVGNAVPPLMSYALACSIRSTLGASTARKPLPMAPAGKEGRSAESRRLRRTN